MEKRENPKEIKISAITSSASCIESASSKKKFWRVDREMLRFKAHYFLFEGALGTFIPFMAVFAKNRINMSATSLATILITQQFFFIFTKPMFGYIADYFNKLKVTIASLAVIQGIFLFLLLPIPSIEKQVQIINNSHYCEATSFDFLQSKSLGNSTIHDKCRLQLKCNDTLMHRKIATKISTFSVPCSFSTVSNLESQNKSVQVIAQCPVSHKDLPTQRILNKESTEYTLRSECVVLLKNYAKGSLISHYRTNYDPFSSIISFYSVNETYCLTEDHFRETNETAEKISGEPISFKSDFCCKYIDDQNISCLPIKKESPELETTPSNKSDFKTYQFWTFALLLTVSAACVNALFTLSDTACCDSVQKTGGDFGRQRLWGAVGWGVMGPVGGFLNDYTDDYLASCVLMGVMSLAALWNIKSLELVKPQFSQNILKDVGTVLKGKEFLAFGLSTMINGMGAGIMWSYFFWFLITLDASKLLCGITQSVECFIGEIPFLFFSGWMIRKVGHFNVLNMSLLAYSVRFFWYSRVYNPWHVLPMEIMHGFTYGFFISAVASYAKTNAKPGTEATTQALLFTTHEGLGAGLGCILAGLGFDHLGGHATFFYAGLFCGCGALLSSFCTHCLGKCSKTVKATSSEGA